MGCVSSKTHEPANRVTQQPKPAPTPVKQEKAPVNEKPIPTNRSDKKTVIVASDGKPAETILGKGYQDLNKYYELGKVLGRGQFGTTRLAKDIKTHKLYACKSIATRKLVAKEDREDVRREVQIMHHLKGHPNITYLVAALEDRTSVHLIMDLCSGGELFDRITKQGYYSEAAAAATIRTLLSVVAHCHSLGVMHRDLKPENFLMTTKSPDAEIKCTDFGLSVFFKPGELFQDIVGSAYYVAPEVLNRRYGPEADVWSCGVILYILLSGMPPFWGNSEAEVFDSVLKSGIDFETDPWPAISQEAKDCVARMLVKNPRERASVAELLRHPWLRENGMASDKPLNDVIISRLGTFATHNKLKREAMRIIASGMPEDEIAGLRSIFVSIDKDSSGTITAEELRAALRQKGAELRPEDLRRLISLIDSDANGTIDYEEFLAATLSQHQMMKEEHILRAFQHFDQDNSGQISLDELKSALVKQGGGVSREAEQEIINIIKEVDKDNDGQIDYDEFFDMMMKNRQSALKVVKKKSDTRGDLNAYKASKARLV